MAGFFEALKASVQRAAAENDAFASRGLDVIPNTSEVRDFCLKKVRWQMTSQFIRPCIFSVLVFGGMTFFRFMREQNGISFADEDKTGYLIAAAVAVVIPMIAYLIFFEGYKYLRRGQYELYGGYCLRMDKSGRQVKMNGVFLPVDSLRYDTVSLSCYFYIMRVPLKSKTMYFFAAVEKSAADARTGEFYPQDIW